MDQTTGLHIELTAADEGVKAELGSLEERLAQLERAFTRQASAASNASKDVQQLTSRYGSLGRVASETSGHIGNVTSAFSKLGGSSSALGGITTKLGGLGSMLSGIPGPAMAAGAAIAAIGAAATALIAAADKAAHFQDATIQLRLALHSAGETQAGLTQKLLAFADVQEQTTIYTRTQAVDALAQLTTAGMNAAQAQSALVAAENVSARTHVNVTRVMRSLEMAYHGNTASLQRYGIQVKDAHGKILPFAASMALLQERFRGAAQAAGEAGTGPMVRLQHAFTTLQEKIGALVLPMLQKLAETLIWLVNSAEAVFKQWEAQAHAWYLRNKEAFDAIARVVTTNWNQIKTVVEVVAGTIYGYIKAWVGALMDTFTFFADLLEGHWGKLWGDVKAIGVDAWHNLMSAFGNFGDNFVRMAENIAKGVAHVFMAVFSAMGDALHGNFARARTDLAGTFSGFSMASIGAGLRPLNMGILGGGGAGAAAGASSGAINAASFWSGAAAPLLHGAHGAHKAAHHAATQAAKEERAAVRALQQEVRQYISTEDLAAQKHKANAEQYVVAIHKEIAALHHFESTHRLTANERIAIERRINTLEQQSAHITQQAERAKQHAIAHTLALQHRALLASEHAEAKAARQQQHLLQQQQRAWQHYYQSVQQEAQRFADKLQPLFESLFQSTTKTIQRGGHTFTEHISAWKNEWKKFLDEAKKAFEKSIFFELMFGMTSGGKAGMPNFMSVFAQNMGFGKGVGAAPAAAGAGTSAGPLSMLGGIGSMFGGLGSLLHIGGVAPTALGIGGKSAVGAGITGGMSGGIIGALLGQAAATQIASALPTSSIMEMLFGVGAPTVAGALGSAGSGGIASAASSAAAAAAHGGASGVLGSLGGIGQGGIGSILKGGIPAIKGFLGGIGSIFGTNVFGGMLVPGATIGSIGLGGLGGYLLSSLLGPAIFKNQPMNQGYKIGGALGGAAGAAFGGTAAALLGLQLGAFAGPVGALVGALLGTVVGGLFGNHDNPANMPDKYNTASYGQAIANLGGYGAGPEYTGLQNAGGMEGPYNANGTPFTISSQISAITTGITANMAGGPDPSEIAAIEVELAKYGSKANAPPWLQPLWDPLVATFGIDASGSGYLHHGHNIGKVWIDGAAGTQYSASNPTTYTAMQSLASQFLEAYSTQGTIGVQPGGGGNPITGSPGGGGSWFGTPFSAAYEIATPGGAPMLTDLSSMPTLNLTSGGGTSAPAPTSGGGTMYPGGNKSGTIPRRPETGGGMKSILPPRVQPVWGEAAPEGSVPGPQTGGGVMYPGGNESGTIPGFVSTAGAVSAPGAPPLHPGSIVGGGMRGILPPRVQPVAGEAGGGMRFPLPITIHVHVGGNVTSETALLDKLQNELGPKLAEFMLPKGSAMHGIAIP